MTSVGLKKHAGRLPDWKPRLIAYLYSIGREPEAPGTFDCQLFIAGAIEAMTGHDYAAAYRGRYSTIAEGQALLKADGFRSHIDLVRKSLAEKHVSRAAAGDVAQIGKGREAAFGIVQGSGHVYVARPIGFGLTPLSGAFRAFEV